MNKDMRWTLTVQTPTIDRRKNRALVLPGLLTKAVGVDGRLTGELTPFPGFHRLQQWTVNPAGGTINYFRYHAIEKGTTGAVLSGFVIKCRATSGTYTGKDRISFYYYDSGAAAWSEYEILDESAGWAGDISSDTSGKYLYVARDSTTGYTVWYNGSAMTQATFGIASGDVQPAAPTSGAAATTGGALRDGKISIAYRFFDSRRNLYSGMSLPLQVTLSGGTTTQKVPSVTAAGSADYDTVQVYRTISFDLGGTVYDTGIYFLDCTVSMPATPAPYTWTANVGLVSSATSAGADEQLVQQRRYDPILEAASVAPASKAIATFEGVTYMGGPENTTSYRRNQLRWSPPTEFMPELFPPENIKRFPESNDELVGFCKTDSSLFGLSKSTIWQIRPYGARLLVNRRHTRRGPVNAASAHSVGGDLFMLTPLGFVVVDGEHGDMQLIAALDGYVNNDWKASLSSVFSCVDGATAASYFVNTTTETAVVLWHATNSVTELQDMNFLAGTQGLDPVTRATDRAFFVNAAGLIVYPDAAGTNTKRTMLDVTGTVNGTASGGDATTLNDATASFMGASGLAGAKLWMLTGANAGLARTITSNTGTAITCSAFPSAIASGDTYAVSPVVFDVRFWPLGATDEGEAPTNIFRRRLVSSMGANVVGLAGEYTTANPNAYLTFCVYRQEETTPGATANKALSALSDEMFAGLKRDGSIVECGVQCKAANVMFRLVGVQAYGRLSDSQSIGS